MTAGLQPGLDGPLASCRGPEAEERGYSAAGLHWHHLWRGRGICSSLSFSPIRTWDRRKPPSTALFRSGTAAALALGPGPDQSPAERTACGGEAGTWASWRPRASHCT
eukprot:scaffold1220_cov259-Pinguiococcus_pyrenoidosus.AAC.59